MSESATASEIHLLREILVSPDPTAHWFRTVPLILARCQRKGLITYEQDPGGTPGATVLVITSVGLAALTRNKETVDLYAESIGACGEKNHLRPNPSYRAASCCGVAVMRMWKHCPFCGCVLPPEVESAPPDSRATAPSVKL